jgi:hypothetical protein
MKIPAHITRYSDRISYLERVLGEAEEGRRRAAAVAYRQSIQPQLDELDRQADEAMKEHDSAAMTRLMSEIDALLSGGG